MSKFSIYLAIVAIVAITGVFAVVCSENSEGAIVEPNNPDLPNQPTSVLIGDLWYSFSGSTASIRGVVSEDLTTITIPESVTYDGVTYSTITIQDVNTIVEPEQRAFAGMHNLQTVNICSDFQSSLSNPFCDCPLLSTFIIAPNVTKYTVVDGVLISVGGSSNDSIVCYPATKQDATYTSASTTITVYAGAFWGNKYLTEAHLESIVYLGGFVDCVALEKVYYGSGVRTVINTPSDTLFPGCVSLEEFGDFSSSSYSAQGGVLYGKSNNKITQVVAYPANRPGVTYEFPSTVTSIGSRAFQDAQNLESLVIPEGVTVINGSAFTGAKNLKSISLPASLTNTTNIGTAISDSSIENITVSSNSTTFSAIGGYLLSKDGTILYGTGGGLTDVEIPSSVTTLERFCVSKSCVSLIIPSSVELVKGYAFYGGYGSLEYLTIEGDTSFQASVFYGVDKDFNILITGTPTFNQNTFKSIFSNGAYYPQYNIINLSGTDIQPGMYGLPSSEAKNAPIITDELSVQSLSMLQKTETGGETEVITTQDNGTTATIIRIIPIFAIIGIILGIVGLFYVQNYNRDTY